MKRENAKGAILVTGASSGIGLETALHLAEAGYRVYATMRDLARRSDLDREARERQLSVEVLQLDITEPPSIRKAVETIAAGPTPLYGVVNNAGSILRGYFEDVTEAEIRRVVDANFFGTMAVTRAVLPLLREARRGRIVIMSSTGGRLGSPGNVAYCSSKFALEGFAECLSQELAVFNIRVSLVEPGFVRTELFGRNRNVADGAMAQGSPYAGWFRKLEELTDREVQNATTSTKDVAAAVLHIMETERPLLRYLVGRRARLLFSLRRYLPGETFDRVWIREITRRITGSRA